MIDLLHLRPVERARRAFFLVIATRQTSPLARDYLREKTERVYSARTVAEVVELLDGSSKVLFYNILDEQLAPTKGG